MHVRKHRNYHQQRRSRPCCQHVGADARQRVAAGGQWTRREVPLTIGAELAHADQKSRGLRFLLQVLFEEERQAFIDAVSAAADKCAPVS